MMLTELMRKRRVANANVANTRHKEGEIGANFSNFSRISISKPSQKVGRLANFSNFSRISISKPSQKVGRAEP